MDTALSPILHRAVSNTGRPSEPLLGWVGHYESRLIAETPIRATGEITPVPKGILPDQLCTELAMVFTAFCVSVLQLPRWKNPAAAKRP